MIRIAAVQTAPQFGRREENLEAVAKAIRGARADLFVLPELFNTGYLFADRDELACMAEPYPNGPTCQQLATLSRERRAVIAGGFAERTRDGRIYNSGAVFDRGEGLLCYRKIHLFDTERRLFDAGDRPPTAVATSIGPIGAMVCFDWFFPETMRCLALEGASIVVHMANLVLPYCQDAMKTRCLENRVFAVTANRIGTEARGTEQIRFTGRSQITGVRGEVLARAEPESAEVILAEIDPHEAEEKSVTARNDVFADRRPGLYKALL